MNYLVMVAQGVRRSGLRNILVIATLTASIVGLVALAAADTAIRTAVQRQAVLEFGLAPNFLIRGYAGPAALQNVRLLDNALRSFSEGGSSQAIVARLNSARLQSSRPSDVSVVFTSRSFRSIRPVEVDHGGWLVDHPQSNVAAVVLNRAAREATGLKVNDATTIRSLPGAAELPGVIVGIVNDGSQSQDAYVDLKMAQWFLEQSPSEVSAEYMTFAPGFDTGSLSSRLNGLVGLGLPAADFSVTRVDTVQSLDAVVDSSGRAIEVVSWLCLLIGILALSNIGLSALRERSSELVLRRALGGSRALVFFLMLGESIVAALPAAAAASALSFVTYLPLVNQISTLRPEEIPAFPWQVAWTGLLVAVAATVLSGSIVAVYATRLRPVAVMRT